MTKCTFDEYRNGNPCGRYLAGGLFCVVHDRVKCGCGCRLVGGKEETCPKCGKDVRLQTTLKGG